MTSWDELFEKIYKINVTLDEMLGKNPRMTVKSNMRILTEDFGLTKDDAKAWLDQEPNYEPIRRFFTDKKSDKDLTEPIIAMLIFSDLCVR